MINKILFVLAVIVAFVYVGFSMYFAYTLTHSSSGNVVKKLSKEHVPSILYPGITFFAKTFYDSRLK